MRAVRCRDVTRHRGDAYGVHVPFIEIQNVWCDGEGTCGAVRQCDGTDERDTHEVHGGIDACDLSADAKERAVDHAQESCGECGVAAHHRRHGEHTCVRIGQHLFQRLHGDGRAGKCFQPTNGREDRRIVDDAAQCAAPLDEHCKHVRITWLVQKTMHAPLKAQCSALVDELRQGDAHRGRRARSDGLEQRCTIERRLAEFRNEDIRRRGVQRRQRLGGCRGQHHLPLGTHRAQRATMHFCNVMFIVQQDKPHPFRPDGAPARDRARQVHQEVSARPEPT